MYSQQELPKFFLKNNFENRIDISKIDTNNVTVFIFWATWCVPCINELDIISEVYEDWKNETKVKIIAISIDDNRSVSRVKPLINSKGWEFQVLFDTNQEFKRIMNVTNIPYLIMVKNNKIIFSKSGYVFGSEIELYEKIKKNTF